MKTTNKPTVFFDFDNMLFPIDTELINFLNTTYSVKITEKEFEGNENNIDIILKNKVLGNITHELNRDSVYKKIGEEFHCNVFLQKDIQPFPYAKDIILLLAEKYNLVLVTTRQEKSRGAVSYMLETHFPRCFSYLHFVHRERDNGTFEVNSKLDFIQEYPEEKICFFDDSLSNINTLQEVIPSYLFDPNKKHHDNKKIKDRVHCWRDIRQILL